MSKKADVTGVVLSAGLGSRIKPLSFEVGRLESRVNGQFLLFPGDIFTTHNAAMGGGHDGAAI